MTVANKKKNNKAKHETEMKNRDLIKKTGAMIFTEAATLVAFVVKV